MIVSLSPGRLASELRWIATLTLSHPEMLPIANQYPRVHQQGWLHEYHFHVVQLDI